MAYSGCIIPRLKEQMVQLDHLVIMVGIGGKFLKGRIISHLENRPFEDGAFEWETTFNIYLTDCMRMNSDPPLYIHKTPNNCNNQMDKEGLHKSYINLLQPKKGTRPKRSLSLSKVK